MIALLKKIYESRYTIWMMAIREMKSAYIGSLLGFFWTVVSPLAQFVIYGIVFGIFYKTKPDAQYGTDSYFLFLLCGLIPWQFFAQTISASANVLILNKNLIKRAAGFNSEILPLVTVIGNIISHFIGIGLLLTIVVLCTGHFSVVTPVILLYLFIIVFFTVGITWILSSINAYFRDVHQATNVLIMSWMFLTPIFYSSSIIPISILPFIKLNPLFHMVEGYRYALLAGKMLPIVDVASMALISFLTFGIGGMIFRRLKPGFAEVL